MTWLGPIGLSLLLAACGGTAGSTGSAAATAGGAPGRVEITLWNTQAGPNGESLKAMVDQFNSSQPNITVKDEFAGNYDDEYKKLLAAAKGGGVPELAVAYENVVAELMKAKIVVPLDSYVNGPDGISKDSLDDIFPGYIATNTFKQYGNQLLSFPFTKSNVMAYYNTDLLSAAGVTTTPRTWDDYAAAMRKVSDYAKSKGTAFNGGDALDPTASYIDLKILSRGGALMADDLTKVAFNNPQAITALQWDADLVKAGAAYQQKTPDWQNDFASQTAAARLDSSTAATFLPQIIQQAPKQFKWMSAAPPTDGTHNLTVMYGANIAMFKSTPEKQAAAWQFIKWFSDTPQTAQWALKTHYLPVRKSAANLPEFQNELATNPSTKAAFDSLPVAVPEPNVAGWQQIRDILHDAETAVLAGKATPKTALDEAEVKANKALADTR